MYHRPRILNDFQKFQNFMFGHSSILQWAGWLIFFIVPAFSQPVWPASVTDWLSLQKPYLDVLYPVKLLSEAQKAIMKATALVIIGWFPFLWVKVQHVSQLCCIVDSYTYCQYCLPLLWFIPSWFTGSVKKRKKRKKKTPSFTNEPLVHEQKHQKNLIFTVMYLFMFFL